MKILDEESINHVPFHDSDLLSIRLEQNDQGKTDLIVSISFHHDDIEDLYRDFPNAVGPSGLSLLKFSDCHWININAFCNQTKRDEIDYLEFKEESPSIMKGMKHVEVVLVSGSKIECHVKEMMLCAGGAGSKK